MKNSNVIPKDEQDHFWIVVRQCIRKFHAECATRTLTEATRLKKRVNEMPVKQMELFYHAEPFDVACNLADNILDVKDYLDDYLAIRDSNARRENASHGTASGRSA